MNMLLWPIIMGFIREWICQNLKNHQKLLLLSIVVILVYKHPWLLLLLEMLKFSIFYFFFKIFIQILSGAHTLEVGGHYFDLLLRDYFVVQFKEKYNIDVTKNPRAMFRLLDECEKVCKSISANYFFVLA